MEGTFRWFACAWLLVSLGIFYHSQRIFSALDRIHRSNQALSVLDTPTVPAIPRQQRSSKNLSSSETSHNTEIRCYHQDYAVIGGKAIAYRIHLTHFQTNKNHDDAKSKLVVVGALSSWNATRQRAEIRQTWGRQQNANASKMAAKAESPVLFLVGGSWNDAIQDEFALHHDLVWINHTESYRSITWKVVAFYTVAARHFPGYYGLKTDDDSYVQMHTLLQRIHHPKPDQSRTQFWGRRTPAARPVREAGPWFVPEHLFPEARFPPYAQGAGYVLSPDLIQCMARVAQVQPVIGVEDANTGILARSCRVPCQDTQRFEHNRVPFNRRNANRLVIWHHVKNMTRLHRQLNDFARNKAMSSPTAES